LKTGDNYQKKACISEKGSNIIHLNILLSMKKLLIIASFLSFTMFWTACEKTEDEMEEISEVTDAESPEATEENTDNPNASPDMPVSTVAFEEENHNFGKIQEGTLAEHVFKFKNTGENPLVIKNVKPSCGCTASEWTKEPITPGGDGFIKIGFDSNGKVGTQNKSVTVELNIGERVKTLTFQGEVIAKK